MKEIKKKLTNKNWFIEKRLRTHFDRFPEISKCFIRIGDPSVFTSEVLVLRDTFGWQEQKNETNISSTCLLIAISKCGTRDLDITLKNYTQTNLILLYIGECGKTTPLYSKLEAFGFRMMFEWEGVAYFSKVTFKVISLSERKTIEDPDIRSILKRSWRRVSRLPDSTAVDLIAIHAVDLLTADRFDIAIKCLYGRLWKDAQAKAWREYVYYEHLLRITGPGPNVAEFDGTGKEGIDNFMTGFQSLLSELNSQNIPAVPVDINLSAFDGAHRIAAAIVMNRPLCAVRIDAHNQSTVDTVFFKGKSHGHSPCLAAILDEAAIEYCRIKKGLAIVLIFPTVNSEAYAIDHLSSVCRLVYKKNIDCSPEIGNSLLRQVYLGQSWLEEQDENSGFLHKVKSCFPYPGKLRVILIDDVDPRKLRPTKELIRTYYGVGNHSIHITDGDDEVLRIAKVLFNDNSIDLLKMGVSELPGFHDKLITYRNWLEQTNCDDEAFCIDGSAILALLGLRECRDIDFLFHGDPEKLPKTPDLIDVHNSQEKYYNETIANIVGDPRLHCWYMGVKFCSPYLVLEMKQKRNELKDRVDVALLRSKLPEEQPYWINRITILRMRSGFIFRAIVTRSVLRIKVILRPIVHIIRRKLNEKNK